VSARFLIAFDLDGTLVDSRLDLAQSTNEMLSTYGAAPLPEDEVVRMVGEGARVLVERALSASGLDPGEPDALPRFLRIYDRRLLIHTRPYDGIPATVERLAAEADLAVLTNKPEAPSRRLLDAFELTRYFRSIIGGDSGYSRKPDPASLRHLMAESGTGPRTTVLVGDSMIDVRTARNAGVPIAVAAFGFGHLRDEIRVSGEDLVAETPVDLGRVLTDAISAARARLDPNRIRVEEQ
jgi:phosphoglycolate phosphatase